ncbi:exonuclease SbcC [Halalkalibacter akibai JCM 9157]|uniref:Nuclease SbcCD subunit C n=1 Tax=Halalkalibacter akibai (strain ATCC 43226 / DSM 21942 / CIP 109018 / JCM 9157 / 1139) TaxID=1236973 RepID=W4QTA0_HALA3|nr:SMC family ATPase [Halalkalibacter akibai]GAE34858.1 exonuclease SbcC [Halalkalibacter akibai JCM 9157]
MNQKIQDIIGLTKDQFRQIVMLPQGEFRKLLTSDTENKEEILRKIFRTVHFKQMTEGLNEKRVESQKHFEANKQERDLTMKNLEKNLPAREGSILFEVLNQDHYNTHQVIEALAKEIDFYREQQQTLKKQVLQKKDQLTKSTTTYHHSKAINDRFTALEKHLEHKELLEKEQSTIDIKKHRLQEAEKASQIELQERFLKELEMEESQLQDQVKQLKHELNNASELLSGVQSAFLIEEKKAPEREAAHFLVNKLKDMISEVAALDKKKQKVSILKQEVATCKQQNDDISSQTTELKKEKVSLTSELKELEKMVQKLPETSELNQTTRQKLKVVNECISLSTKATEISKQAFNEEEKLGTLKEEYEQLETRWIEGQASLLALHLHNGDPCPVCGSKEHPDLAESQQEIPTKEQLEQKRMLKDQVEGIYRTLQARIESLNNQLTEKETDLQVLGIDHKDLNSVYSDLEEAGQELEKKLTQLRADQDKFGKVRSKLEHVENKLEELEMTKEENDNTLHQLLANYQTEQALFEEKLQTIPEHLQSNQALAVEIEKAENDKQLLDHAWKSIQIKLNQAKEQKLRAETTLNSLAKQLETTLERKEKAAFNFKEVLLKANFQSTEDYNQAKLTETERAELKEEIELYTSHLQAITKQVADLQVELKGKERQDLNQLLELISTLEYELEQVQRSLSQITHYLESATTASSDICHAHEKVKDAEEIYYLHKDLYDVVRGENSKKISFERFLQIEFLEEIIQAANQRLNRLSNGQFHLIRSDRLEKRGKQSGLSLDVFDNYTGHNRDVKTLSGGEKFNASLSLALGMADVIQSHQGGISIETMFIDEGFGSLDEESLNKAIDTLIDLQQSGRLIGVISHVQELKQAIPAILDVRKMREGHSETRFLIK